MKSARGLWILASVISFFIAAIAQTPGDKPAHKHHVYKLVDLGTFGGEQGSFNPEGNGGPYINSKGAAVGQTQTKVALPGDSNPFLCYPGPNVNHAFLWQGHKAVDLGALRPSVENCSDALAVNDRGEIAGQSSTTAVDPQLGLRELRAVVWRDGIIHDLGTFGGNESGAGSINRSGQVAGFALNVVPDPYSIFGFIFNNSRNSTQTRAFLWQNGHKWDLGTLGGPDAHILPGGSINDAGQVAGVSYTNAIPNATTQFPTLHPFLWNGRSMLDLGSLGGTMGAAFSLNNHGEVTGVSSLAGDTAQHGYFWSRGHMQDLGTFGGTQSEGDSVNDRGEVVGSAYFPGDAIRHAFLWSGGKLRDIGILPGDKCSAAWSINNHRQVVGNSGMCGYGIRSFLWEEGEIVNLNDLVEPRSDVVLDDVVAIADNGEIAVNGLTPGCNDEDVCGHPYLLIPVRECDDERSANITASQPPAAELAGEFVTEADALSNAEAVKRTVTAFRQELLRKYRFQDHASGDR